MPKTILVVEDDDDIRHGLCEMLRGEGYAADEAANGQAALDYLAAHGGHDPCIILLDMMMPVMNGYQFLEKLLARHIGIIIPVVLMTASTVEEPLPDGVKLVRKPFNLEVLLTEVRKHCDV